MATSMMLSFLRARPRDPYPGTLGVVEAGAVADLLLVDGDPLASIKLLEDPGKDLVVMMKDAKIYRNAVAASGNGMVRPCSCPTGE